LASEELLRGAFDFAPVLGDGVVQKPGHISIRSLYQDERSLLLESLERRPWAVKKILQLELVALAIASCIDESLLLSARANSHTAPA